MSFQKSWLILHSNSTPQLWPSNPNRYNFHPLLHPVIPGSTLSRTLLAWKLVFLPRRYKKTEPASNNSSPGCMVRKWSTHYPVHVSEIRGIGLWACSSYALTAGSHSKSVPFRSPPLSLLKSPRRRVAQACTRPCREAHVRGFAPPFGNKRALSPSRLLPPKAPPNYILTQTAIVSLNGSFVNLETVPHGTYGEIKYELGWIRIRTYLH